MFDEWRRRESVAETPLLSLKTVGLCMKIIRVAIDI